MHQDRRALTAGPVGAFRPPRPGFERPVDHLHFDRRARVWRRHEEHTTMTTQAIASVQLSDAAVSA